MEPMPLTEPNPYGQVHEAVVHLWPADHAYGTAPRGEAWGNWDGDERCTDTPCVGVMIGDLGAWDHWENYHGTGLVVVEPTWHGSQATWFVTELDWWADAHPDLADLWMRKDWADRLVNPRPADLAPLLRDLEAHLRGRGWVDMVECWERLPSGATRMWMAGPPATP